MTFHLMMTFYHMMTFHHMMTFQNIQYDGIQSFLQYHVWWTSIILWCLSITIFMIPINYTIAVERLQHWLCTLCQHPKYEDAKAPNYDEVGWLEARPHQPRRSAPCPCLGHRGQWLWGGRESKPLGTEQLETPKGKHKCKHPWETHIGNTKQSASIGNPKL